ncbi:hypothetical protein EDB80DRAFT_737743 [Ilyonectria destructans]|nr:hypothetical protein EDB80DRAFT_737743 [Ilyonectria destructans]
MNGVLRLYVASSQIATLAMDRTQLASRIESTVGFRPRPGQVEAVYKLVVDQKDLVLIAPTGWGKSVVFQAVPALRGGICIMIMPLTLLEEDQARSISKIPGCNPCILNATTNSPALLEDIRNGTYTHVLLGPELALSEALFFDMLHLFEVVVCSDSGWLLPPQSYRFCCCL